MKVLRAGLLFGLLSHRCLGKKIPVFWDAPFTSSFGVNVGDELEFVWSDQLLDIYRNPDFSCDTRDAVALYSPATVGGTFSYVISEDPGEDIFFSTSDEYVPMMTMRFLDILIVFC